ncbi:ufm1-specific protease 1 [Nephila pilipes]|uniref:Ufm1-specific protease 1 n=1 Tax=Nephila pilipes TaxID=299642 RepID=A0A8X6P0E2_NEPPI|nr:ufm1-specific protease 1 [Nephila pilipes]
MGDLVEDVHLDIPLPANESKSVLIRGSYFYYHYLCDGINDAGWGCGYRTLQTICSWIKRQLDIKKNYSAPKVPSINEIQKALVVMGDKDLQFIGSKQWIGSLEVAFCVEYFYKIQCRIIHCRNIQELHKHVNDITQHFMDFGSPIMMGGDKDCSSKGILGISETENGTFLLILDPHFQEHLKNREKLQSDGWIKWKNIDELDPSSFYNLCCPLIKSN